MTEPDGRDHLHSDLQSDLSAGLRRLAAGGFDTSGSESEPSPVGGQSDRPAELHPLPPLAGPVLESHRRPPSPEGLLIADRILAAAGHRSFIDRVSGQVGQLEQRNQSEGRRLRSEANTVPPPSHNGDTTVLPRTAIITSTDGDTFILRDGETLTIGRVPGPGELAVNHVEVSRLHVRLEMRLGQLLATDLGSTNGTTVVSGQSNTELKPQSATALAEGDRLVVGADVPLCAVERIEWQA